MHTHGFMVNAVKPGIGFVRARNLLIKIKTPLSLRDLESPDIFTCLIEHLEVVLGDIFPFCSLLQAFTERTQFLQGLARALSWIQQQERKALIDDHIALLPEDLAKQVAACRGVHSALRAYQRELASLWVQGRELERDASDKERGETLGKLQNLQAASEAALHKTMQRLSDLEKALTSRKYFQVDLDKTCQWLKQADAVTFPEINSGPGDDVAELQAELSKFQNVLEQASEYENLLLIVQRIGQEFLPTLNEIDHCYLEERLNALPQQYNAILALAKEKRDRVQQIILEQKEFSTFFEITRNALEELQEQFDNLEKQTISMKEEDFACLVDEYGNIERGLSHISTAVRELQGKNEGYLSRGQHYRAEETEQLVSHHNRLTKVNNQKIKRLTSSAKMLAEHRQAVTELDTECTSVREKLTGLQRERESTFDTITCLYSLLERLDRAKSQVEEYSRQCDGLGSGFDPAAIRDKTRHLESVQSLRKEAKHLIEQGKTEIAESREFVREIEKMLGWMSALKDTAEGRPSISEVSHGRLAGEMHRLETIEEEVESTLAIGRALCDREKQRHSKGKETLPADVEKKLQELERLGQEVQQGIGHKKVQTHSNSLPLLIFYGSF